MARKSSLGSEPSEVTLPTGVFTQNPQLDSNIIDILGDVNIKPSQKIATIIKLLRESRKMAMREFGKRVMGVTSSTISLWELEKIWPDDDNLEKIAKLCGYTLKEFKDFLKPTKESLEAESDIDEKTPTFELLLSKYRRKLLHMQERGIKVDRSKLPEHVYQDRSSLGILGDRLPDLSGFYGREAELAELGTLVEKNQCLLVHGPAGIGKSSVVGKLIEKIKQESSTSSFDFYFWSSVGDARNLEDLISKLLNLGSEVLSEIPLDGLKLPERPYTKIDLLIKFFRHCRCLLVLDDAEIITDAALEPDQRCLDYQNFIQNLIKTQHQSCIVLISRNSLSEIESWEKKGYSVATYKLKGLGIEAKQIFENHKLPVEEHILKDLIFWYQGNPESLLHVIDCTKKLCGGDIKKYINNKYSTSAEPAQRFLTSNQLKAQGFNNLAPLEKEVLCYLAKTLDLNRETTLKDVLTNFSSNRIPKTTKIHLYEAIETLIEMALIQKSDKSSGETLLRLEPEIKERILKEVGSVN